MKKKIILGLVAAVMALAIGVTLGTVSPQIDSFFCENLEALSITENNGKLQCYPLDNDGELIVQNGVICLNDVPGHCTYPHSYRSVHTTQDCLYSN